MADIEELFAEMVPKEKVKLSPGEAFARRIEEDYTNYTPEQQSREEEREKINKEIKDLELKIRMCPNVKNYRLTTVNAERAKKRKNYTTQIAMLKLRLDEIKIEEGKRDSKT